MGYTCRSVIISADDKENNVKINRKKKNIHCEILAICFALSDVISFRNIS
jgi:hypothetical protein